MRARLPYERTLKTAKKQMFEYEVERRANELTEKRELYSTDLTIMAAVITLVKKFGWGTNNQATRIPRFIDGCSETLHYFIDRYDPDCAFAAMKKYLEENNIEYEMETTKND